MLAFDIETTGLDASKHAITVVALYGTVGNEKVDLVLNFARDGIEVTCSCRVCVCVCVHDIVVSAAARQAIGLYVPCKGTMCVQCGALRHPVHHAFPVCTHGHMQRMGGKALRPL